MQQMSTGWSVDLRLDQLDCTLFQSSNANPVYYPSFQQLMSEISTSDKVPTKTGVDEDYHLIPGDIMAVNPETEDGILSGDTWWLPQVSRVFQQVKHQMAVMFQDFGLKWYLLLNSQSMVLPWDSKEGTVQFVMGVSQNPEVNQQSHQLNRSTQGGNMGQLSTSGQTIMYSIFIRSLRIFEWLFVFQMKAQVVRRVKMKI